MKKILLYTLIGLLLGLWAPLGALLLLWFSPHSAPELPGFIALQKQYEKQGLTVIGVSVDQIQATEVKKFAQKSGMNYPVMLSDSNTDQAFGGIEAIPTTFVIDREGRIVKQHLGFTEKEEFEKEIKPLLNP